MLKWIDNIIFEHYIECVELLPISVLMIGLFATVCLDAYMQRRQKRILLLLCSLVTSLIVQTLLDYLFSGKPELVVARKLVCIYGYAIRPVILILFLYVVSPERKIRVPWILAGVNAVLYSLTAFGIDLCFTISPGNYWHHGIGLWSYTCTITSFLILACLFVLSIREFSVTKARDAWIPVFATVLILLAVFLDSRVTRQARAGSFLLDAIVIDCVLYYSWLHLRFVRAHEEDLKAQQRIEIMMSQIQPHFLYNTLTTIQSLCRTNPEKAFDVTGRFGVYLRQNLDSLGQTELVPLQKELEHTRIYTEIEQVRFPRIRVEYDIADERFLLPALTIQPMVENAIRHGVRGNKDGLVTVVTRRIEGFHEIVISDNGKGFDLEAARQADAPHIGIQNVRERIERMCGGTFAIDSRIGEGTVVTMRIPMMKNDTEGA